MSGDIEIEIRGLNFYYAGNVHALKGISLSAYKNAVTALIGPQLREDNPAEML